MEEINDKLYEMFLEKLGWKLEYEKLGPNPSFARITEQLVYESFYELLLDFKETKGARRASVVSPNKWHRLKLEDLDGYSMRDLEDLAEDSGFMYVSFYPMEERGGYQNNEIRFEEIGERFKSKIVNTRLEIPWEERSLYNYSHSGILCKEIKTIHGIIDPKCYFKILEYSLKQ